MTFDRHPLALLAAERAPRTLTTISRRAALAARLGVREMVVLPFDDELASMPPQQFIDDVLVEVLSVEHVSVGANFRFGHRAEGDVRTLSANPRFVTRIAPLLELDGRRISSTRIREAVEGGDLTAASRLLGAPFALSARIVDAALGRERWACRVTGQYRSTQRREPVAAGNDEAVRAALRAFACERKRWGYRRAHEHLVEQGWQINRKRVQRLWREEGLRVPRRRRKHPPVGDGPDGRTIAAAGEDDVWAIDFQADQTACGRPLRLINVLDEHTRQALTMAVGRSASADQVVGELERLIAARGRAPRFSRMDNGPELTSHALRNWCRFNQAGTVFIEPGCPWQNPFVESFHARVATSCSTSSSSPAWPKRASSSATGARTTTPTAPTRRSAGRHRAAFATAQRAAAA